MAQKHLDPLSAVDAAFLHQEGGRTHMHIGGVALLDGPPLEIEAVREHIRSRLRFVPRYRQRLAVPPAGLGRPRWVDDPAFNLEYHVRHTALPRPGDEERLRRLVGRIFSQALDRTKPLWELWVVEGLADDRVALVSKTHHALVDGVSGVDLMTMLFDLDREPRRVAGDEDPWQPRPAPSAAELAATAVGGAARRLAGLPLAAAALAARPAEALASAGETVAGLGEVAWAALNPPARTPLDVRIGPHRRFHGVSTRLEDFKAIKDGLGGTVNDVVLAVVAGGLAHWLHERGLRTSGLQMRACVPVSIRTHDEQGAFGNRLTQVLAPLPVDVLDPLERLDAVKRAMSGVKESKQALGAEAIAGMQGFAPPTILAQASRMNFSSRFYNLLVTNIPGPQFPLYLLGRRLQSVYPVAFLAGDRALAVAAMSYDGEVDFGLLGDLDALPDLPVIGDGIEATLAELVALAGGDPPRGPRPVGGRRSPGGHRSRSRGRDRGRVGMMGS